MKVGFFFVLFSGAFLGSLVEATVDGTCTETPTRRIIRRDSPSPTATPTTSPTPAPTNPPTPGPTDAPTPAPTNPPTPAPTNPPTPAPTNTPTATPTDAPIVVNQYSVTPGPTCTDRPIDVCIAIDMSGSVCSPHNAVQSCTGCPSACNDNIGAEHPGMCCNNYVDVLEFSSAFVDGFGGAQDFSVVSFSTYSNIATGLTTQAVAQSSIAGLVYEGGLTNTGTAIDQCRQTLNDASSQKVIVLISDGTPTTGDPSGSNHFQYASDMAALAKSQGSYIVPVVINSGDINVPYMQSLGTKADHSIMVSDFGQLNNTVQELVDMVQCAGIDTLSTSTSSLTPAPAPVLTAAPTCNDVPIDICVSIDMSGSICSPHDAIQSCSSWPDACCSSGASKCCGNYHDTLNFAKAFINEFGPSQDFSVVAFSSNSNIESQLTDLASATAAIEALNYTGGTTATADSIGHCHSTLTDSTSERVMLLITDGTPTACVGCSSTEDYYDTATEKANLAKADGVRIIPVVINSGSTDTYFLKTLATNYQDMVEVGDFGQLASTLNNIVDTVKCGAAADNGGWMTYSDWDFTAGDTYNYDTSGPWICGSMHDSADCKYGTTWDTNNMHGLNGGKAMMLRHGTSGTSASSMYATDIPTSGHTQMKISFDFIADQQEDNGDHFVVEYAAGSSFSGLQQAAAYHCCGNGPNEYQNDVATSKSLIIDLSSAQTSSPAYSDSGLAATSSNYITGSFTVDFPITEISFAISGGSGDADLYVKKGSAPSTSSYHCRPYKTGNVEDCSSNDGDISVGQDTYYWMVRAYSSFQNVNIDIVTDGVSTGAVPDFVSVRFRTVNSHDNDEIFVYRTKIEMM